MPNIQEYNAPQGLGLRPVETGVESTAAAARRLQSDYFEAAAAKQSIGQHFGSAIKAAGDVTVKFAEHQEISQGAAALAGDTAKYAKQWDDISRTATPGDPTIAPKFMEGLNKDLDAFKGRFFTEGGQKWAESRVDALRNHFETKTRADVARSEVEAAVVHEAQRLNNLSSAVFIDPSSLPDVLKQYETDHNAIVGSSNIPAEHLPAMRQHLEAGKAQLVKAAVTGAIQNKNGGNWEKIASENQSYVNLAEMKQFADADRRLRRAEEADKRSEQREQRIADQSNAMDRSQEFLDKYINPDTGEHTFPKNFRAQVLTDPVLAKARTIRAGLLRDYDALEKGDKQEKLTAESHRNWVEMMGRIRSGDIVNEDPIWDNAEHLTRTDLNSLRKELADMRTPDGQTMGRDRDHFFKTFSRLIDADYNLNEGKHSLLGERKAYEFEMAARQAEQAVRAKGGNPHDVYDPRSPDYFGKPENIAKYHVSLQEAQKYQKDFLAGRLPEQQPPKPQASEVRPRSKAEMQALPPGTVFIAPDGSRRIKQ